MYTTWRDGSLTEAHNSLAPLHKIFNKGIHELYVVHQKFDVNWFYLITFDIMREKQLVHHSSLVGAALCCFIHIPMTKYTSLAHFAVFPNGPFQQPVDVCSFCFKRSLYRYGSIRVFPHGGQQWKFHPLLCITSPCLRPLRLTRLKCTSEEVKMGHCIHNASPYMVR